MRESRGRFRGVVQILTFNRDFYVSGLLAIVVGASVLVFVKLPFLLLLAGCIGLGVAAWWWVVSILASWWIYDHSALMDWNWIESFAPTPHPRWVNLHCGLDESTPQLIRLWGDPVGVFDFFDPSQMTEPSILRARTLVVNPEASESASFSALPIDSDSLDLACVVFSAHELRDAKCREELFRELFRGLKSGGRLLVVEHLRDLPNFLVFGPGFFHFFPRSQWIRTGEESGFSLRQEAKMTPYVSALVWEK
jgi:SAM-dependent methyltransferase